MHNSAFQNFMIAPGSMMGGPQGFMNPKDYGIMQSQYGGTSMGLGSSPYGYMYDNPIVSKFAMETGIMSRPMGTNYASTAQHQANVNTLVGSTFLSGAIDTAGGLGGMAAGAMAGAAVGGLPGAIVGGIAGSMMGEGIVSPLTDVLDRRTVEKMSVHQSLGALANNDSPYGGGFGFSRKAAQSVYQNMENLAMEDASFTTGEMTMMMSEGINSGEISGDTVSELNKKLEKTKETIKALSQITGNNKIGELSDMIRQMVTVGFDSSAVTDVSHGIAFAARRLGQNPDDYRNKLVQSAQNEEAYGGAGAAPSILSTAFVDSTLANNSNLRGSIGNKDNVKSATQNLFSYAERNMNSSNTHGLNIAGISSEAQRTFVADAFAKEKFGKDNEEELQKRMETGITRGTALSAMWASASKDIKKDYAQGGYDDMKEAFSARDGINNTMTDIGLKANDLYDSPTALLVHKRDKSTMMNQANAFSAVLSDSIGAKQITSDRLKTVNSMLALGGGYGIKESLGQDSLAVLDELNRQEESGELEKQNSMRETDKRAGLAANLRRDNTVTAKVIKTKNWFTAKWGQMTSDLLPTGEDDEEGTGQKFTDKMIFGENKKMFDVRNTSNLETMSNLEKLKEATATGSLSLSNVGSSSLGKRRWLDNTGPAINPEKGPAKERDVQNASDLVTGETESGFIGAVPENRKRVGPNAALAMFASGAQKNQFKEDVMLESERDIDAFQSGKISSKEYKARDKERFDETIEQLQYVSDAIEDGTSMEEIDSNMGKYARANFGTFTIDKALQMRKREKRRDPKGERKSNIVDDRIALLQTIKEESKGFSAEDVVGPEKSVEDSTGFGTDTRDAGFTTTAGVDLSSEDRERLGTKNEYKDTISFTSTTRKERSIFDDGSIGKSASKPKKEGEKTISADEMLEKNPNVDLTKFFETVEFDPANKDSKDKGEELSKPDMGPSKRKKQELDILMGSGGSLKQFGAAIGQDWSDLTRAEATEAIGMIGENKFSQPIAEKFIAGEDGKVDGYDIKSAQKIQQAFSKDAKNNIDAGIFADSKYVDSFKNINTSRDKSKLELESSSNEALGDAIKTYDAMSKEDKEGVFAAAKLIEFNRSTLDKKDGSDFYNDTMTALKTGDLSLTKEQMSAATEISKTTAIKESATADDFSNKVNEFSGAKAGKDALSKVWNVDLTSGDKADAAQGLLGILTADNKDGQKGMSEAAVKGLVIGEDGKVKSQEEINKSPASRAAYEAFKEIGAEKKMSDDALAKVISGREIGDEIADMAGLGGRDMGALHSAVNGGESSGDTMVSLLRDILQAIKDGKPGVVTGDVNRVGKTEGN